MHLRDSILPECIPGVVYTIAGIATATIIFSKLSRSPNLDAIPTVGSSSWLGSWWAGYKFKWNSIDVLQEGYQKYKSAPFKVADRYRWIVILGDRQHLEEVRKAPDDALSLREATREMSQTKYTLGPEVLHESYHGEILRSRLTRNLSNLYPEVRDELSVAFDEVLDLKSNEWKTVHALSAIQKVVCRTSNRIFAGLPLCRDPDWISINLRYTLEVVQASRRIRLFPSFLAPIIAYFTAGVLKTKKQAMELLNPVIEERLKLRQEYGNDWPGKPNDMLSWMLDEAPEGPERTTKVWTSRMLVTNFAAIHTTSSSFYNAIFFLAENPEYMQPLREEVESAVRKEGWSKAALGKMSKIDSFLRESQRLAGIATVSLVRKTLKDYTFSDGTFIPKGTFVAAPARCLHLNDEYYDNAHAFDPFRFSNMRDEEGEGTKYHFVSTSPEYLAFGHGKHACPGRFFAASELKSMLAHVVMTYDVKMEDNKTRPKEERNGLTLVLDPTAKIMFRKRAP